jgi:hypothetical protein
MPSWLDLRATRVLAGVSGQGISRAKVSRADLDIGGYSRFRLSGELGAADFESLQRD